MFCKKCGKENNNKANFCIYCGNRIFKKNNAKDVTLKDTSKTRSRSKKKISRMNYFTALLILAVLTVVGYIYGVQKNFMISNIGFSFALMIYYFFDKRKEKKRGKEKWFDVSFYFSILFLVFCMVVYIANLEITNKKYIEQFEDEKFEKLFGHLTIAPGGVMKGGKNCIDIDTKPLSCDYKKGICYDYNNQLLNTCVYSRSKTGILSMIAEFKNGRLNEQQEFDEEGVVAYIQYNSGILSSIKWMKKGKKFKNLFSDLINEKKIYDICLKTSQEHNFCLKYSKCYKIEMETRITELFSLPTGYVNSQDLEKISEISSNICLTTLNE